MPVKTAPEISLRYAQGQVFNCEKRFRVLVAGRRFGKSYLSCIVTLISNKLFNLDLECIQYTHKIYVVTAQLQNNY